MGGGSFETLDPLPHGYVCRLGYRKQYTQLTQVSWFSQLFRYSISKIDIQIIQIVFKYMYLYLIY